MKKSTYILIPILLFLVLSCTHKKKKYIGIQPYKGFDEHLLKEVVRAVEKTYQMPVVELEEKELPKSAFINVKSPRYRADTLIRHLHGEKPDSIKYILGITGKDISTTKRDRMGNVKKPESRYRDWGVFGLGYLGKAGCVISTYRISGMSQRLLTERLQKIAVHELGHNMGLRHCPTPGCVMQDAVETVKTVDNANLELCGKCKKKLK